MSTIKKGERRVLNVTDKGNRRVFVGLSWDPSEEHSFFNKIKEIVRKTGSLDYSKQQTKKLAEKAKKMLLKNTKH